jgi:hypothetical protein
MKSSLILAMVLSTMALAAPISAFAMPVVGDIIGTNPKDATAALEKAGCKLDAFEAEDGKVEARCIDAASGKTMEIAIDPKTGAVTDIKSGD